MRSFGGRARQFQRVTRRKPPRAPAAVFPPPCPQGDFSSASLAGWSLPDPLTCSQTNTADASSGALGSSADVTSSCTGTNAAFSAKGMVTRAGPLGSIYAEAEVAAVNITAASAPATERTVCGGIYARLSNASDFDSLTGYVLFVISPWFTGGTQTVNQVYRLNGDGSITGFGGGSFSSTLPQVGDVFRLEIEDDGSTCTCRAYRNGNLRHTVVDASPPPAESRIGLSVAFRHSGIGPPSGDDFKWGAYNACNL